MFERIEYLVQNDYLKSEALIIEYKPIKNNSEMIHNLCLKYNITKNTALLDRIVSYQNDIIEKEHMILSGVLNELYELLKDKNNLRGLR
jgi:hypothetical protein